MRKLLIAVALSAATVAAQEEAAQAPDAETAATPARSVAEAKGFRLEYQVDGDNLVGTLSYQTTGWVAVGINPTKKMAGADFIIGYAADGKGVVMDHFGVGTVKHKPDEEVGGRNTIVKAECSEKDGVTTLWFTIPLNSGDSTDVVLEKGKEYPVIFGAGKRDNTTSKHNAVAKASIKL